MPTPHSEQNQPSHTGAALWGGRFEGAADPLFRRFNDSLRFDYRLARQDIFGSIGWANLKGRHYRVGGWGLAVSDEGSGAWLGREALRRVLWAHDARIEWTPFLTTLFEQFRNDVR